MHLKVILIIITAIIIGGIFYYWFVVKPNTKTSDEVFNEIMTPGNIDLRCKNLAEEFYKKYNDPKDLTYIECMKDYETKPQ